MILKSRQKERKRTKEINLELDQLITDYKYHEKVKNALLYLPKEQVEKYVEIDKRMNPEDIVCREHNFNRYVTIMSFWIFDRSYWYWWNV